MNEFTGPGRVDLCDVRSVEVCHRVTSVFNVFKHSNLPRTIVFYQLNLTASTKTYFFDNSIPLES